MEWNFDTVVNRRGTGCLKYDFAAERGYPEDVLPLWIADMDFPAPACVREALEQAARHGIFGYAGVKDDYYDAVRGWFARRFDWQTERDWICVTPGVVFALSAAVRAATEAGDAVMIQPPVYGPFYNVIRESGRKTVENPLSYWDGRYTVDFGDFERKIAENRVKLFLLCSPHNPVGRVFTEAELREMGEICRKYAVTVVSDEIHCDFTLPGHPHTPFLKACPEWAERIIVCTAPSKSFNLAGLQVSNIIIPGRALREKFRRAVYLTGYSEPNYPGVLACRAAYTGAEAWLEACKAYLRENLAYVREFLKRRLPKIRLVEPEGTYFAWLDCAELGYSGEELNDLLIRRGKLWLNGGGAFGKDAAQFQRMVLACPRATLEEAMTRLENAFGESGGISRIP